MRRALLTAPLLLTFPLTVRVTPNSKTRSRGPAVAHAEARLALSPSHIPEEEEEEEETPSALPETTTSSTAPPHTYPHGFPVPAGSLHGGRAILGSPRGTFATEYDGRTRQALWSCEQWRNEGVGGGQSSADRANSRFFEDERIPARFRARLSDYRGSGYDRGHLVPAGSQKYTQETMDSTFSLTNISPQVGKGFNRDYWARLEQFARDFQEHGGRFSHVSVCSGPLWLPTKTKEGEAHLSVRVLGDPPSVWVPTHFFKVVLAEDIDPDSGSPRFLFAAFILPNAFIPDETPLEVFAVTREEVEAAAGFSFFSKVLRAPEGGDKKEMARESGSAHVEALDDPDSGSPLKRDEEESRLCDVHQCALPPPNFWQIRKKQQA